MARNTLLAYLVLATFSVVYALHTGPSPAPRATAGAAPTQTLGLRGGGGLGSLGLTKHGVIKFHGAMAFVVAAQFVGEAFGYPVPAIGLADYW